MNQTLFDECFDNTKNEYYRILKLIEENKDYPKIKTEGRELHHIIPCAYFMKINNISRKESKKLQECKDEDNLISLSYIDHVKIHYFYYKCCKKFLRSECTLSIHLMLNTRDVKLKDVTEKWINENKDEIIKLKNEFKKIQSNCNMKYKNFDELYEDYINGRVDREHFTSVCYYRKWDYDKIDKRMYKSFEELKSDYDNNKINRETFTSVCRYNNWDYEKLPRKRKYNSFEELKLDYDNGITNRTNFTSYCNRYGWNYDRKNEYSSFEELNSAYENGLISKTSYRETCRNHGWEYERILNSYSSFEELKLKLDNGKITRHMFTSVCKYRGWDYEKLPRKKKYETLEDIKNAYENGKMKRNTLMILCKRRGWDYRDVDKLIEEEKLK